MTAVKKERKLFVRDASAVFDPSGVYRYALWRWWTDDLKDQRFVNFVMLNPSTADGEKDDPTIKKCMSYADAWGFKRLAVTNLFALRSTDPTNIETGWSDVVKRKVDDPIGPQNDETIKSIAFHATAIIGAWGNDGWLLDRPAAVKQLLRPYATKFYFLRMNGTGEPAHPLFLPSSLTPMLWEKRL